MRHRVERVANWLLELVSMTIILVAAWYLRFRPTGRPGYDVDELVYSAVAGNWVEHGFLGLKPEYIDAVPKAYGSHPFFMFWPLIAWYKARYYLGIEPVTGVLAERELSAWASLVTIVLVWWVLRSTLKPAMAVMAAGWLAFDGWVVFTNRVGWVENIQIPMGIVALWLTHEAAQRVELRNTRGLRLPIGWLVTAGLALGSVLVFKHVGVCFTLAGLLYLLLGRAGWKSLGIVLSTVAFCIAGYVWLMVNWLGSVYLRDTLNQFLRVTGLIKSPGSVENSSDVFGALFSNYSIYLVSVGILAIAGIMVGWRLLQLVVPPLRYVGGYQQNTEPIWRTHSLVWCWTVCTYGVFVAGRLKLPHYLILLIVPAVCYIAAELNYWLERQKYQNWRRNFVIVLTLAVMMNGVWSWQVRMVSSRDNAVLDAIVWMNQNVPTDKHVVSDEFMGQWIDHPYCRISHVRRCVEVAGIPDYVIVYTTRTQQLPADLALANLLANSVIVDGTEGFKERIRIYRYR